MKHKQRLRLEQLEDRHLLATFGVPWPDAQHLTLSFVPDGTSVDGYQSSLFKSMHSGKADDWEAVILRAAQTWASQANINITVVPDGGQPLGTPGAPEGDPRFGDIRIAAHPLASDACALATPFDPTAGTRAGDIVFNSSMQFTDKPGNKFDLFTVALHEFGHVFGIGDSSDHNSAMYENYNGKSSGLAPVDVQAIQALYGPRVPDAYEGATGDDSFATAAPLTLPDIQGDISSPTDLDYYRFTVPTGASGTMTVSVQSSGVSLLTPKLSVFDGQQNLIATSTATGLGTGADALHALAFNGDVTITLNNVRPGQTYYFKVESGTQDVFGVGAYRLKTVTSLSSLLQIGYLDAVYSGAAAPSITVGARANDTLSTAVALTRSTDNGQDFLVKAAISDPTDVDYYSVVVPGAGGAAPQTLNASVTALGGGLYPTLTVYDQTGQQVNATILTNSPGDYVVQVANAAAGATYYVEVSAMPGYASHSTGGYSLAVSFSAPAAQLNTLASNTLSNSSGGVQQDVFGLKIAETELAHFVLSANTPGASVATGVRLQIFDNQGTLVLCLDAFNGQTVSADVFLKKGVYTMSIVAATKDGSPLAPTTYLVQTKSLTDPLNPVPIDPTNPPPTDSTTTTSPTPAPPPSSPWDPTTYTMSYPMYG